MSKARPLTIVGIAYVLAVAVAAAWLVWGPTTGRPWLDTLIADIFAMLVVFALSRIYPNSSFYDAYRSVIPPLLLFFWWAQSGPGVEQWRCWLVAILVVVWAIRLTGNWVYAFPGLHHEDWRYPMFRERAGRWEVVAVALEFVADAQLHRFVRDRRPGQVMDRGLWSWSRHPNYFGEFGFWFALALFGVAASPADAWWLFIGALAMLAIFLGASIPMMEARSLQRRPDYQAFIDRVSRFVPRPPAKVRA